MQSLSLSHSLVSWLTRLAHLFWGSPGAILGARNYRWAPHPLVTRFWGHRLCFLCFPAKHSSLWDFSLLLHPLSIYCLQAQTLGRNCTKNVSTPALGILSHLTVGTNYSTVSVEHTSLIEARWMTEWGGYHTPSCKSIPIPYNCLSTFLFLDFLC